MTAITMQDFEVALKIHEAAYEACEIFSDRDKYTYTEYLEALAAEIERALEALNH